MRSGGLPAGSSRALRLDPFSLPARFAAIDAAADERVRHVELYRERVVVRRSLAGMRMALNMPVSAFAGVALRVTAGEGAGRRHRRAGTQRSFARRCRCSSRPRPTRPSPNGAPGATCWACRCWSPKRTACLREPFARMGGVRIDAGAAAPAPPQRAQAPPAVDAAAPQGRASSPTRRRSIAASARSSPGIRLWETYLQRCSLIVPPCCCCISI